MQILDRLSEEMYAELGKLPKILGVLKAEVLRMTFKEYIARVGDERMRGIVKPKISFERLEEIY